MSSATSLASTLTQGLRRLVGIEAAEPTPYRIIDVELKQRIQLSPSLARLVFGGPDVDQARTLAPDQRIKLFFPAPDGSPSQLPHPGDWRKALRQLDTPQRPAMRTYTIRALRTEACELDVDFVLHGVNGPASAWATNARIGDRLQMVVPNLAYTQDPGGYEWQPPAGIQHVLLIGDETAIPAIAGILEQLADLPDTPRVQAFIEVPHEADCIALHCAPGTQLNWLPRNVLQSAQGEAMLHAARELASLPAPGQPGRALEDIDLEQQILWELAKPANNEFYAWVAGESATVMAIRRHLINERRLDRNNLTLMGYWRLGRSLE